MSWMFGPSTSFNTVPRPRDQFTGVRWYQGISCTYVGDPADKDGLTQLGLSVMPMDDPEERPKMRSSAGTHGSGGSSTGESWGGQSLEGDWGPTVHMGGNGSSDVYDPDTSFDLPLCYAADLYINGEKAAELTLLPVEGGAR